MERSGIFSLYQEGSEISKNEISIKSSSYLFINIFGEILFHFFIIKLTMNFIFQN